MNPPSEADLARVGAQLGRALRARDWQLATAESSTGGLIGHAITMTAGASDYYAGGVIGYSNLAKEAMLGVPRELIEANGAVSEEVAAALAEGAAHRFEADLGVSVTGIAGPDGGSERKPIGTHYVGVARRDAPAARRAPRLRPRPQRQPGRGRHGSPGARARRGLGGGLMRPGERIHLIGIAGSGAAGVALLPASRRSARSTAATRTLRRPTRRRSTPPASASSAATTRRTWRAWSGW